MSSDGTHIHHRRESCGFNQESVVLDHLYRYLWVIFVIYDHCCNIHESLSSLSELSSSTDFERMHVVPYTHDNFEAVAKDYTRNATRQLNFSSSTRAIRVRGVVFCVGHRRD